MMPISPITGSSITATVVSVVAARIAPMSLKATWTKPGGKGANGSEYLGCPPAVTAARGRPWDEPARGVIFQAPAPLALAPLRAGLVAAPFAPAPAVAQENRPRNGSP